MNELTEQDYQHLHHILNLRKMDCEHYIDNPPQFMNDESYWIEERDKLTSILEKIQNILNTF